MLSTEFWAGFVWGCCVCGVLILALFAYEIREKLRTG